MRLKISVLGTALLLVLATAFPGLAAVITVDQGGTGDYLTIVEGLGAALAGDTVLVLSGTYSESVTVNKALILRSDLGSGTVTITGPESNINVLTVAVDGATVEGFSIDGGQHGLYVADGVTSLAVSDLVLGDTGSFQASLQAPSIAGVVPDLTLVPHTSGKLDAVQVRTGTISSSQTWPLLPVGFAYYLNGVTVTVRGAAGPVLTIATGSIVKSWFSRFEIASASEPGGLMADGVIFTSVYDDTGGDTNGATGTPGAGNWQRLDFNAMARTDSSRVVNCELRYGGSGTGVIEVVGSNPTVGGCIFTDNQIDLFVSGSPDQGATLTGNTLNQGSGHPVATNIDCLQNLVFGNTIVPRGDNKWNGISLFTSTVSTSYTLPVLPHGFNYYLNGATITVKGASGPVLTIPSGSIIKSWFSRFEIGSATESGGLMADGVIFTSAYDDTGGDTNGATGTPGAGNWQRLDFNAMARTDSSRVVNCELRYGGNGTGAIEAAGSNPTVGGCTFTENQTDLYVSGSPDQAATMTGNTLNQGSGLPVATNIDCLQNLIFGNTIVPRGDSKWNGIRVFSSTVPTSYTLPVLPHSFVYYLNGATITVKGASGPVLTIPSGSIIKSWFSRFEIASSTESGGLMADGVIFTSTNDDFGGDTNGSTSGPGAGNWQRLDFNAMARSDSSRVVNCELRYGGNGTGAIEAAGSNPTVGGCTFTENQTDLYVSGSPDQAATMTGNTLNQGSGLPVATNIDCLQNLIFGNTIVPRGDSKWNGIRVFSSTVPTSYTLPVLPHSFVYYLNGATITVKGASGPVLTIPTGSIIKSWFSRFEIASATESGGLMADGVIFTSTNDDFGGDTNGSTSGPGAGNWQRLDFNAMARSDSSRVVNCELRYGGNGTGAIEAAGSNPAIGGCTFTENQTDLYVWDSPDQAVTMTGNTLNQGAGQPVATEVDCLDNLVLGNTIVPRGDDKWNGIRLFSSTVSSSYEMPVLPHDFVYYLNGATITVVGASDPVLTIASGTIIKSWFSRFEIGSTTEAGGLVADGVIFTSALDDLGGDTNGATGTPAPGNWHRIDFNPMALDDASRLTNCELRYGGNGGSTVEANTASPYLDACLISQSSTAAVLTTGDGARPTLKFCTLTDNVTGLKAQNDGYANLIRCCITGNSSYGVEALAPTEFWGTFTAEGCWWGAADGPSGVGPGSGDAVSDNINFTPWATAEACLDFPSGIEISELPSHLTVAGAYPNPFNPSTEIAFVLPSEGPVQVDIFTLDGKRIARLLDESMAAGPQAVTWRGRDDRGRGVAAGLYFYSIKAGDEREVGKLMLVK